MSDYVPGGVTAISPSSYFSADPIDVAFDNLATWSLTVGDYQSNNGNIRNDGLVDARKIKPGTTSKVWTSSYSGNNAYMLWKAGSSSDNSPVGGDDLENGEYDVPGASLNFYLREDVAANRLLMKSSVPMWKAREANFFDIFNQITDATFEIHLKGYLDGDPINFGTPVLPDAAVKYEISGITPNMSFTRRGLGLNFWGTNEDVVSKGLHRFKVRMTFTVTYTVAGAAAPPNTWLFNHIKGGPPVSSVTAIYK